MAPNTLPLAITVAGPRVNRKSGIFLALAVLLWAGNFIAGEIVVASMDVVDITFIRWAAASIPLVIMAQVIERPSWGFVLRQWPRLLGMAVLGLVGYSILLFLALGYTSAMNASLIDAVNPTLLVILGVVLLRERVSKLGVVGIVLGLFGVLLVVTEGNLLAVFTRTLNPGDLFMVAGIVVWSFYALLGRQLRSVPPITSTAVQAVLATLVLAPVVAVRGLTLPSTPGEVTALLYIIVFASVVAFALWNAALVTTPASQAGVYLNLMVPFTAIISIAFGGSISAVQLLGGAFVIGGVILTSWPGRATPQRVGFVA